MAKRHFTPALYSFLRELTEHNEKTWWEQNKDRYIESVREPALEFISDFAPRLAAISKHFVADSRTSGGSLMRPYRDTRFSADKTPYKTNVGIQFRHETGKDVHAPGFYLHLEPAGSFAGVGMWRPDAATAGRVRQQIAGHPDEWSDATGSPPFTEVWALEHDEDEMLKRVPREFGGDPRHGDDLRLRSFVAVARLTQKEITSGGLDARLGKMFGRSARFVRFLCDAIGAGY